MRMWSGVGDSTAPAHVDALLGGATPNLMPTDPPYGVNYAPEWRAHVDGGASHAVGRVANDHRADWTAAYRLFTGDVVYAWHAGLYASTVAASPPGRRVRSARANHVAEAALRPEPGGLSLWA